MTDPLLNIKLPKDHDRFGMALTEHLLKHYPDLERADPGVSAQVLVQLSTVMGALLANIALKQGADVFDAVYFNMTKRILDEAGAVARKAGEISKAQIDGESATKN